eukprot:scaffold23401_cov91-Skeletonema_menzelii.AAC.1
MPWGIMYVLPSIWQRGASRIPLQLAWASMDSKKVNTFGTIMLNSPVKLQSPSLESRTDEATPATHLTS